MGSSSFNHSPMQAVNVYLAEIQDDLKGFQKEHIIRANNVCKALWLNIQPPFLITVFITFPDQ